MVSTADQYRTIASGAGWLEHAGRGRLCVSGRDRVAFLQALLSNDVLTLASGRGLYATYLTPQGRMLADLWLHDRGDDLLVEAPAAGAAALAQRLDQLVFTEDVQVADVSAELAQLIVIGPRAAEVLADVFRSRGFDAARLERLSTLAHEAAGDVLVARSDAVALPAFEVFVPAALRGETEQALSAAGALGASPDLLEALRIEAGRPAWGAELTEDTIPLEAGLLDRAISTTKGCYVGQEIVVRILHRGGGRVARHVVKIEFDPPGEAPPAPGASLRSEGREAGRITSAASSAIDGRAIALAIVHRDHASVGESLRVGSQPDRLARIAGDAG
jgi:folate-binding protein YgfZ